jgi:hypothetical protein
MGSCDSIVPVNAWLAEIIAQRVTVGLWQRTGKVIQMIQGINASVHKKIVLAPSMKNPATRTAQNASFFSVLRSSTSQNFSFRATFLALCTLYATAALGRSFQPNSVAVLSPEFNWWV